MQNAAIEFNATLNVPADVAPPNAPQVEAVRSLSRDEMEMVGGGGIIFIFE